MAELRMSGERYLTQTNILDCPGECELYYVDYCNRLIDMF